MPNGLADVMPRPANEARTRPAPRAPRTTRSTVLSFLVSIVSLPFEFESVRALGELVAEDLVDERASLRESRVDDFPQHAAILTRTLDQTVALKHREVLRHIRPADVEQLGQLAGRARRVAEVVHELVPRGVRECGEHRGVNGVTLSVVVHETIIAKLRNFATWQSLDR